MAGKGLNLFGEFAIECVHLLFPQEEECIVLRRVLLPQQEYFFLRRKLNVRTCHHSKFTEDVNCNKQKWCYCQSKSFSGTSGDTERHLKTSRIIFNEMSVLLVILYW